MGHGVGSLLMVSGVNISWDYNQVSKQLPHSITHLRKVITLWKFNIAIENGHL